MSNFFKMRKIMVFDFYLEEKRQLLTTVYMNAMFYQLKYNGQKTDRGDNLGW